jgi:hypothetical protein
MPEKRGEANLKKRSLFSARRPVLHMSVNRGMPRVVVHFKKDSCQGIAFRRAGKLGDSITRVAQLFDTSRSGAKARPCWSCFGTAEAMP